MQEQPPLVKKNLEEIYGLHRPMYRGYKHT